MKGGEISRRTFIKMGILAAVLAGASFGGYSYLIGNRNQKDENKRAYKTILHAYREDFPLMGHLPNDNNIYTPTPSIDLSALFDKLILDLSGFSTLPTWSYIARHTDDSVQEDVLEKKKSQYPEFVSALGDKASYNMPTVWFVVFSPTQEITDGIKEGMDKNNIKYREQYLGEIDDLFDMPPDGAYSITKKEGREFYKFLNQTTQIGIDLLRADAYGARKEFGMLKALELGSLEIGTGAQIYEMEHYIRGKSGYYRQHILNNLDEYADFWDNFTIAHAKDGFVYSWPHFLFNIVGS